MITSYSTNHKSVAGASYRSFPVLNGRELQSSASFFKQKDVLGVLNCAKMHI